MQHERDRNEMAIAKGFIVAVIAIIVILNAGAIKRGSAAGSMGHVLWSINIGNIGTSPNPPAIGDVDGDGSKEIIISSDTNVYCISSSGMIKWSKSLGVSLSIPVLAQADHDKALEIFLYGSSSLFCLKGNGSIKWQASVPNTIVNCIAIADVDHDNNTEIFLSASSNRIYCFSGNNGTMIWSSPPSMSIVSLLIAGTSADGSASLFAGSTNGTLMCMYARNSSVRWTTQFSNVPITPLAAYDTAGDGIIYLIVKTSTLACVYGSNGSVKWQLLSQPGPIDNVVIGDVNRDGQLEIITAPPKNTSGKIYCFSAPTGAILWQSALSYQGVLLYIADINNDKGWEICFSSSASIVALAGINGTQVWNFSPNSGPYSSVSIYTFALSDVNSDGILEMIYYYYYQYDQGKTRYYYFYVECAQLLGPSWAQSPSWSCYAGSVLHTNAFLDPDHDGVSTSMEIAIGTNPNKNDTDGDGIADGVEIGNFTNPLDINDSGIFVPTLTFDTISPSNGNKSTMFNFTVIYSEQNNNAPVYIKLVLDGNSINMQKQIPSDINYTSGVGYTHSMYLSSGNHSWWIKAADLRFSTRTQQRNILVGMIPGSPQNLQAFGGNGQIILTWQVPADNGGMPITNYSIYRGTSPERETFLCTVGNATTWTDTNLTNGQIYYYVVCTMSSAGEGARSNEASATITPTVVSLAIHVEILAFLVVIGLVMTISIVAVSRRIKARNLRMISIDFFDDEDAKEINPSILHPTIATMILQEARKMRPLARFDLSQYMTSENSIQNQEQECGISSVPIASSILRVTQEEFHASSKHDNESFKRLSSLLCASCNIHVDAFNLFLDKLVLYYCRCCNEPLIMEISCPACDEKITFQQEESCIAKDHRLECPVCHEIM